MSSTSESPNGSSEAAPIIVVAPQVPSNENLGGRTELPSSAMVEAKPTLEQTLKSIDAQSSENLSSNRSHRSRSRSRGSRGSRGSKRSKSSSASSPGYRVIFSTPAHYDHWILGILALPLALILVQMIALLVATAQIADFERSGTVWALGWAMILILGLYMTVLPKQVDIRSNGTIGVKSSLITYQFDDVCHAYLAGLGPSAAALGFSTKSPSCVSTYRFATCLDSSRQLVIRRRNGKWDVMISPYQTEEFLRTLRSMITKLEIQRGTYNVVVVTGDATGSDGSLTSNDDLERQTAATTPSEALPTTAL